MEISELQTNTVFAQPLSNTYNELFYKDFQNIFFYNTTQRLEAAVYGCAVKGWEISKKF